MYQPYMFLEPNTISMSLPNMKEAKSHSLDGILCSFEHRSKALKVWVPLKKPFIIS